jgi:hypothetical protein
MKTIRMKVWLPKSIFPEHVFKWVERWHGLTLIKKGLDVDVLAASQQRIDKDDAPYLLTLRPFPKKAKGGKK